MDAGGAGSINQISEAIGALRGEVRALRDYDALESRRAAESRAKVFAKLDEIDRRLTATENTVTELAEHSRRLESLEEAVRDWRALRNKGAGVVFGVLIAAGSAGGVIASWAKRIVNGG